MYLFVLGRQPEFGVAELRAIFGNSVQNHGEFTTYQTPDELGPDVFDRLGSVIKVAKVIGSSGNDMKKALPGTGKVTLGFSTYGTELKPQDLSKIGMGIKKQRGSVRLVPSDGTALSSATVFHNKLARGGNKFEFILAKINGQKVLARTIFVQDIGAYTFRDRSRPKRDARVGMLPPKLAQTMINLAVGNNIGKDQKNTLLDPFCGTGVVLSEATLMGLSVYGTDIEPRMIEFSTHNLDWLKKTHYLEFNEVLETADATSHQWKQPIDFVVCETYLGTPYANPPAQDKLGQNIKTCNTIIEKFLLNIAGQIKPGTTMCIAVPAWFVNGKTYRLEVIKKLGDIGFDLQYPKPLTYHREDQIVGRDLLVLKRKNPTAAIDDGLHLDTIR